MDLDRVVSALIGAFFGAAGWLVVGLYIQRRQALRQARSAGRAVYFELAANEIVLEVAERHATYGTLARGAYERLLPELAAWLSAAELQRIARAYMGHAGYEQLQQGAAIPAPVRAALLARIRQEHGTALDVLRGRAFRRREIEGLGSVPGREDGGAAAASDRDVRERSTEVRRA